MSRLRSEFLSLLQGRRRNVVLATAVGIVAIAVRVPGVYRRPFWEDEVASAQILREPTLLAMLHRVVRTESTPPLWYLLGWLVHQLGAPLQDERLLSVAFGGALAALVFILGNRLLRPSPAVVAALLTALGTQFIAHGHELRSYELLALLTVLFALALLTEVESPSPRHKVAVAATVAAGGLTHFFFAFSVFAAIAWLWLDPGARRARRGATAAIAAGGIVAAAWIPLLLRQYQPHRFWWIGSIRWRYVLAVPLRLFTNIDEGTATGLLLSTTAVATLLIGCILLTRTSATGRAVAALAILPPLAAAVVWAAGMPIFDLRNLIGAGAFIAIAYAGALDRLPRRARAATICVVPAAMIFATATAAPGIPDYTHMARTLVGDGWNPNQPIAVFGSPQSYRLPLEWYLPHQPSLTLVRSGAWRCSNVFLIRPTNQVVRLELPTPLSRDRRLHPTTLLVARQGERGCLTHDVDAESRRAPTSSTASNSRAGQVEPRA